MIYTDIYIYTHYIFRAASKCQGQSVFHECRLIARPQDTSQRGRGKVSDKSRRWERLRAVGDKFLVIETAIRASKEKRA